MTLITVHMGLCLHAHLNIDSKLSVFKNINTFDIFCIKNVFFQKKYFKKKHFTYSNTNVNYIFVPQVLHIQYLVGAAIKMLKDTFSNLHP